MRAVIRVDAATWIGTGHVVRCATLAERLRRRGAEVRFICRQLPGDACRWLTDRKFMVHRLPTANGPCSTDAGRDPAHAAWLGVAAEHDCRETHSILAESAPWDWLIVDHYALDRRWESPMRDCVKRIAVIDDLADREHDCDLLLDQNLVAGLAERYADKVPQQCVSLLGPRFALLQDAYADLRREVRPRKGPVKRLLVFFGGSDPENLTARALTAIESLGRADVAVDVVVGNSNPHRAELTAMVANLPMMKLHRNLPSLAPLMASADLALGAGGATSWECCCLGLPFLVVTFAANQSAIAAELDSRRYIKWLGDSSTVDSATIVNALDDALRSDYREHWSRDCMAQVDGLGTNRVASAILADSDMNLNLRSANPTDEELLLNWANDPLVRSNSFSTHRIEPSRHHKWFTACLADHDNCSIFIAENEMEVPVGQVRFERQASDWQIDYSLDRMFRGLGLGHRLLKEAIARLGSERHDGNLVGCVKATNEVSLRVFEKLGFESHRHGDVAAFVLKEGAW